MSGINDISISISLTGVPLTGKSFRPIVIGAPSGAGIPFAICTELSDVISAGFLSSSEEYKMATALLSQPINPQDFAVYRPPASDTDFPTALANLLLVRQDWYSVNAETNDVTEMEAIADWTEANDRYFIGTTDDTTNVVNIGTYMRTAVLAHDAPEDYPDCAWVGNVIPYPIGSANWKWKRLSGQDEPDPSVFTSTVYAALRAANICALQTQDGSTPFTNFHASTDGTAIDTTMGIDWVKSTMEVNILAVLLSTPKVGLDDRGIPLIESAMREALKNAGDQGIIANAVTKEDQEKSDDGQYMYQVFAPLRSEISSQNMAAGRLPIRFQYYQLVGTNYVQVTGEVIQ